MLRRYLAVRLKDKKLDYVESFDDFDSADYHAFRNGEDDYIVMDRELLTKLNYAADVADSCDVDYYPVGTLEEELREAKIERSMQEAERCLKALQAQNRSPMTQEILANKIDTHNHVRRIKEIDRNKA